MEHFGKFAKENGGVLDVDAFRSAVVALKLGVPLPGIDALGRSVPLTRDGAVDFVAIIDRFVVRTLNPRGSLNPRSPKP